ncbi:MAG TPA: MSMEG_4193 family putative phosphomutase [Acidimicrobiales bacterium]|nr:MSMEG_4193 family putative phosphomutase [Acidimicrobiales bacterium]
MPRRSRPTLLLLVRHGRTPTTGQVLPGRARGLHLSDEGRRQADALAGRLAEWAGGPGPGKVAAVYASPMERARETAAPLAAALGLRVRVERGLNECDFGEWTGRSLKELAKTPEWTTVQRYPSGFGFPGGESFSAMAARIADTVAALCDRHRGQAVVAVSHADPIKAAVAGALGTHLDLFQRIMIAPCSLSAISVSAAGPAVVAVNSTGSLAELAGS